MVSDYLEGIQGVLGHKAYKDRHRTGLDPPLIPLRQIQYREHLEVPFVVLVPCDLDAFPLT